MSIIQFTPDAVSASIDLCGTPVQYTRWNGSRNAIMHGKVMAVHTFIPPRQDEAVSEYFIIPEKACSNLSFHLVDEGDIVGVDNKCQRCDGSGILSIRNGCDDIPCPVCGDIGEVAF